MGPGHRKRITRSLSRAVVGVLVAVSSSLPLSCGSARIGLDQVEPPEAYRRNTASALSGPTLGNATATILRRFGLNELWERDPGACIAYLHDMVAAGTGGRDELFALAELSYLHGGDDRHREPPPPPADFGKLIWRNRVRDDGVAAVPDAARPHYLAAAIYSYAFLFPETRDQRIDPLDPRFRLAADFYEAALAHAFADAGGGELRLAGGEYPLPFGTIEIFFDDSELEWASAR